jgi:uncharacterized membrane protein
VSERAERFVELDIIRGSALTLMIFLHLLWDLDFYNVVPLDTTLYSLNKIVSFTFFLVAGISVSIAYRRKSTYQIVKHGIWIFNVGMGLTIITLILLPQRPIYFGVLHCIGLSLLLSIPFIKFRKYIVFPAFCAIIAGLVMDSIPVQSPSIVQLILGFHQSNVWQYTIDYFPVLPWLGVVLLGVAVGNIAYKDGKRQFRIPNLNPHKSTKIVSFLGKNSLYIYLIHQPIIVAIIKYMLPIIRPLLNI